MDDIPVILIAYKRAWHTAQVLNSLKKHNIQNLFIFSDGPKNNDDLSDVYETRLLFQKIDWCKPKIIEQDKNIGLAKSIVGAVNHVFKDYDRLILLEDDCIPQRYFFDFIEKCLDKYENNEKIFGISGYTVPIPEDILKRYPYDLYFFPRIGSWGWATWKRAWQHFETNLARAYNKAIEYGIDLAQGGDDIPLMLNEMLNGRLKDVWTLHWVLSVYLNKGCYIYPTLSYIENIGMDGSGVHCGATQKFITPMANRKPSRYPDDIKINEDIYKNFKKYYDIQQPNQRKPKGISFKKPSLKIIHICMQDFGGAGKAAYRLHKGLQKIGVNSTMLVLNKKSGDPSVKVLPNDYSSGITNCLDVSVYYSPVWNKQVVRWQKLMLEYPNRPVGLETFTDAVSDVRLDRVREIQDADIINFHWVAGCMDCLSVPLAIGNKPIVWTLHDMNPFTGGCHYAGDCLKYKVSCGACPQLGSDIDDDLSRQVWRQKFDAYKSLNINVVTPSQWLGKCASESKLFSRFPVNVIPNGFPTDIFKPYPKTKIRKAVNIPEFAKIILFGADSVVNERKGFRYLLEALNKFPLKGKRDNIILAFFGHLPEGTKIDSMYPMLNFGSITDENQLAMAYSAADVFVLPSLEDNFPNTVIEAMACGVPVVGFDVGGIPDMIEHKKTGYLVKPKDVYDLIEGIGWAMSSERSFRLSEQCRAKVEKEYTLEVQAKAYSELYERILKDHSRIGKGIFTQAKILNQQGEDLFAKGDLKGALDVFTKALDIAPNYAETHNNLGVVYWQSGIQKALQCFEKALEIDPNNRDTVLNLGDIFKVLGEVNKARVVYLSYLSKNPEDEGVTLAWGELKDKEEDKAIVEIRKAEAKDYLVSAIVSTYCSEEFMRECLENVEDQTISDKLEIVVVDAASPQNEGQIVKEFQKRYANITYIRTKGRIGIYTAWNIAIKASSGKYCISVSTNDHLKREACEVLARALDDNPKCALVYGDTYLTHNPHETFEKNTHFRTYQWPEYRFEDLLQNCMVGPHPMWRKSVHDHIGYFDERYVADGDQEFWLRIGEKYPLLHIPEFIGLQWITINSLSGKGDIPRLEVAHIHAVYQRRYNTAARTMKCSIIIPVFNQVEYTKKCLEALIENTPDDLYEVIIVDNGSTDGTKEFLKCLGGDVKIITNQENLGFAKACNQGARKASGKYLVFLNNDTIPQQGWLDELVRVAGADKDIAVVGSKLLFPDGTIQNAGLAIADSKLLFRHIYRGYPSDFPPANKPRDFQVVTGACMLVKKDIFFDVGGFDEAFVNGCEDIDLCLKVRESGKRVFYNPRSVLTHFEGKTEGKQNKMDDNAKILFERWGDRVKPDYERYLMEDGFRIEETPGGEKKWVYHEELFKPVLSVVIVTCNSLGYIENCLDSIRTQITIPYEVIIIDNNSSDGTRDFLKGLEHVKVILNNENKGFSKATNQGIKLVRGEYVVFLNPDTAVTWDICRARDVLHFNEAVGAVGPDLYPTMQQTCRDTSY